MSGIRVQKFGGASLGDGDAVRRAGTLVRTRGGDRPLVVVSAIEGVTAELERLAKGEGDAARVRIRHRSLLRELGLSGDLVDRHLAELAHLAEHLEHLPRDGGAANGTHIDHLLSFGERMSARIVAAHLRETGVAATPVDAWDLGLVTAPRSARLHRGALESARRALEEVPGIPVVTGFLAADERGNLTTLGKNGSDLTALLLAEAVGAEEVQLWKSVAGIQAADPRVVPHARTLPEVGHAEALELALHGAAVIHPEAVRHAALARTRVELLDARAPEGRGTLLSERTPGSGPLALVHRAGLFDARISLSSSGLAGLLAELDRAGCPAPWFEYRVGRARLALADDGVAREVLERAGATIETGLAGFAVVGRDVGDDADLFARTAGLLASSGVRFRPGVGGARPSSQAWLIGESDLRRTLVLVHDALLGEPAGCQETSGAPGLTGPAILLRRSE